MYTSKSFADSAILSAYINSYVRYLAQLAKEDYLQLRQEVSELQEYSNAKLDRVTRYLGVLASKSRKLGKNSFVFNQSFMLDTQKHFGFITFLSIIVFDWVI